MKKIILYTVVAAMMLTACSSGSDSETQPNRKPDEKDEITLPQSVAKFVGYWINAKDGADYLFRADGTCMQIAYSGNTYEGAWKYDSITSLLTSTADYGAVWNVTLSDGEQWAGISAGDNRICNFTRADDKQLFKLILQTYTWTSDSTSLNISDTYNTAYDGSGTVEYNEYGNIKNRSDGHSIGGGYKCYGNFIKASERVNTSYQKWSNSYLLEYSESENNAAEYSYTLYIQGTRTKTARYQEKIKVAANRYTYVLKEKEYTVPSDAVDGTGTIRLLSSPTTRRKNIRIEFTGRLDGILYSE